MKADDLVSVADIAEVLKLNQQTVRNWIDQGRLRAIRVGRRVRVRWGDVEAMMTPAGPASPGGGTSTPSADGQAFWDGEYVPLVGLPP